MQAPRHPDLLLWMSDLTDPYRVGLDVLAQTGAGQDARRNRVAELAPDFARLAIGFAYGKVFSRPGLDLKLREFAAIAACAAMGRSAAQLRDHVAAALDSLVWCHDLLVDVTGCQSCEESSSDGQV